MSWQPYQPPRGATASEPAIDPRTYSSRTNINQQGSSAQYYSSPLPQTNNTTARYPTPDAITQRPAPQGYSESQYQNIAPYFGQSQAHIPDYHQQQTLTFLEPHQPNMASNPPTSSGVRAPFGGLRGEETETDLFIRPIQPSAHQQNQPAPIPGVQSLASPAAPRSVAARSTPAIHNATAASRRESRVI